MFKALKPKYNRKSKSYDVEYVAKADPVYAYHGYLVFDNAAKALEAVNAGKLLNGWPEPKKEAVKKWLAAH